MTHNLWVSYKKITIFSGIQDRLIEADRSKPLFTFLSMQAVHTPIQARIKDSRIKNWPVYDSRTLWKCLEWNPYNKPRKNFEKCIKILRAKNDEIMQQQQLQWIVWLETLLNSTSNSDIGKTLLLFFHQEHFKQLLIRSREKARMLKFNER